MRSRTSFAGKVLTLATMLTVAAWCLLVLLSWLLSAMMVDGVRSLLCGAGVRWLLGGMPRSLLSPLLVWLLLATMAWGCVKGCGLFGVHGTPAGRRKPALRVAVLLVLVYAVAVALLSVVPHAVLLSPTGTLCHSPFSQALVPLVCCGVVLFSVAYGLTARTFTSFYDIIQAMVGGLAMFAPLLYAYLLLMPLLLSLRYVFCY